MLDLVLTCSTVVAVAFVAELSEPLAAAVATAPITSTAALLVYSRSQAAATRPDAPGPGAPDSESEALAGFAFLIVKGVSASLVFALVFWACVGRLRWSLMEGLAAGYAGT